MGKQTRKPVQRKAAPAGRPKAHKTAEPDGVVRNTQDQILGLNHDGMFYPIDGLLDEDFKEIESHILQERFSPADILKEEFAKLKGDPEIVEMLVDRAYKDMRKKQPSRDRVSAEEVAEYLSTRDGAVHSLWLMMRKHDPEMTRHDVETIFVNCAEEDMHRRIAEANRERIEGAGVKIDDPAEAPAPAEPKVS